jgi:hypothetical protein
LLTERGRRGAITSQTASETSAPTKQIRRIIGPCCIAGLAILGLLEAGLDQLFVSGLDRPHRILESFEDIAGGHSPLADDAVDVEDLVFGKRFREGLWIDAAFERTERQKDRAFDVSRIPLSLFSHIDQDGLFFRHVRQHGLQ